MSAHVKSYDGQTKWMYFFIKDNDLLKKYNNIWDKVSANIKKEFDSVPAYGKKFLKKLKYCLTVMRLQIFTIKIFLNQALIILF